MAREQRRHKRVSVHLSVTYLKASEFVLEYVDNLSSGGVYLRGAHVLPLLEEVWVEIVLPGHGTWKVRARPVYALDEPAAARAGRPAGAGMEITQRPPGYDEALLGYLLRLGRRREVAVMVGDVPGAYAIEEAGYQLVRLESPHAFVGEIARSRIPIIAVVLAAARSADYLDAARAAGLSDAVFSVNSAAEVADIVARIDSLL